MPVDLIPELRIVPFVFEVTQFMDNQVVNDACGCHHDFPVEIDFPFLSEQEAHLFFNSSTEISSMLNPIIPGMQFLILDCGLRGGAVCSFPEYSGLYSVIYVYRFQNLCS